jgi:sec-independent protein translocase protein TatA
MFGSVGGPELVLILIIGLIVFGPRKLPEIGKSVGKMIVEFRKASNDFKRTIEEEVEAEKRATVPAPPIETAALPVPAAAPVPAPAPGTVAQTPSSEAVASELEHERDRS